MSQQKPYRFQKIIRLLCLTAATLLSGCQPEPTAPSNPSGAATTKESGNDLAAARRGFSTQLLRATPSPQRYEDATPPPGVQEVAYSSGDLELKAWLSADPGDGQQHPTVVFLHGGFAFAEVDWQDAQPFVEAGFVLLMPMLRGENGNPGNFEAYYGEVDDAIAAGEFVAQLPYVDKENIFLTGHSAGGVVCALAAMMPSRYKAAAPLSGWLDQSIGIMEKDPALVPYDANNRHEIRLRNPMAFTASLQVPVKLYGEQGEVSRLNLAFQRSARQHGKSCDVVVVDGDHWSMVAPAVEDAISWFREQIKK